MKFTLEIIRIIINQEIMKFTQEIIRIITKKLWSLLKKSSESSPRNYEVYSRNHQNHHQEIMKFTQEIIRIITKKLWSLLKKSSESSPRNYEVYSRNHQKNHQKNIRVFQKLGRDVTPQKTLIQQPPPSDLPVVGWQVACACDATAFAAAAMMRGGSAPNEGRWRSIPRHMPGADLITGGVSNGF